MARQPMVSHTCTWQTEKLLNILDRSMDLVGPQAAYLVAATPKVDENQHHCSDFFAW